MKKLFISLCVLAAVSFTACGGAAKTEAVAETATETLVVETPAEKTVAQLYGELLVKNAELAKKVAAGDTTATTEILAAQEELAKFLEDKKEAMANFTAEELAEIAKIQETIVSEVAPVVEK